MLSISKRMLLDTERATELIKLADNSKTDSDKFNKYCAELYMIMDRYDRYNRSYEHTRVTTDFGKDVENTLGVKSMYNEKSDDTYRLSVNGYNAVKKFLSDTTLYQTDTAIVNEAFDIFINSTMSDIAAEQDDIRSLIDTKLGSNQSWLGRLTDMKLELLCIASLLAVNIINGVVCGKMIDTIDAGKAVELISTVQVSIPLVLETAAATWISLKMFEKAKDNKHKIEQIDDMQTGVERSQLKTYISGNIIQDTDDDKSNKMIVIKSGIKYNTNSITIQIDKLLTEASRMLSKYRVDDTIEERTYTTTVCRGIENEKIANWVGKYGDYMEYWDYINMLALAISLNEKYNYKYDLKEIFKNVRQMMENDSEECTLHSNTDGIDMALVRVEE